MKEAWLKILKPVTFKIAIFRRKNQKFEWKTTLIELNELWDSRGARHRPKLVPRAFLFLTGLKREKPWERS